MIFDIGGGSTELVTFENRKPCTIESAGIGSLNLYNQFVEKIIPKKKELAAGLALLSISSALCLKLMKRVGEKLKKEKMKKPS